MDDEAARRSTDETCSARTCIVAVYAAATVRRACSAVLPPATISRTQSNAASACCSCARKIDEQTKV